MKRRITNILILLALFCLSIANNVYAESASREYLIKAAFIYNFAKFVEWPDKAFAGKETPITLCILGRDPFGKAIESIRGEMIRGRRLVIKVAEELEDLGKCHILFVSRSEKMELDRIFAWIERWNVLTVAAMRGFAEEGGIINFFTSGKKTRFEINISAAERAGLKISSRLLRLAVIITD
ncbi:MAG: YfiR family protein [Thermodesulfobacteriota bacterium]|nr:YfiR family protein [Thermodesulfobacteriota bacterium]